MLEYFILYLLFGVISLIGSFSDDTKRDRVHRVQNLICFFAVLILLTCRHQSMGIDLHWKGTKPDAGYLPFFDYVVKLGKVSFKYYMEVSHWFSFEKGFMVYTWLIKMISSSRQFFMAVTAFLSLLPVGILFKKKSADPVLSWIIFISLSPFLLLYSGLRQGIVIGLAALMYLLAEDNKLLWFIAVGILAFFFHKSAVVLAAIYPLMRIRLNKTWRVISIFAVIPVFVLLKRIVNIMLDFFPQYGYMFNSQQSGSYRFFIVMMVIYVICAFGEDGSSTQNAYMNLFYFSCVFQMLGLVSEVAPRAGFYFMTALCILLPDVISKIKVTDNATLLKIGTIGCFTAWGIYTIYNTGWAMAYPYYWFWETVA